MAGSPDIALVAPGTTFGWRRGDEWFARHVREAGATCQVIPVRLGRAAALRRSMATTDLVEALAARNSARSLSAGAVVYSTVTAALLQPTRHPSAIRFDGIAAVNRPGPGGVWQRLRERPVLEAADLLLPWSGGGTDQARAAGVDTEAITLAPPVETAVPDHRAPDVVAYAANPDKRGLEMIAAVWDVVRPPGARLGIGGIDAPEGRRHLERAGMPEPDGIEWLGAVPRDRWLGLVAGARAYLSAARIEDFGLGQLEALAAGTPLAMAPAPGANAALPLARTLEPPLVASERTVGALATVLRRALDLDDSARGRYAESALEVTAPYREEAVRRRVADLVLPRLLSTSS